VPSGEPSTTGREIRGAGGEPASIADPLAEAIVKQFADKFGS